MTDDIILRAAKAISPEWDRMSANSRRNAVLTVRGVLDAAREPTHEMLQAAYKVAGIGVPLGDIWRAMVDRALADNTV